jgi:putative phage-type endonuclease
MEQRTKAWFQARVGRFTGSDITRLYSTQKTRMGYIVEKAREVLFGLPDTVTTKALLWGIEHEEKAKVLFKMITKEKVRNVGFIDFGDYGGCSPDGMTKTSIIEIKCPISPMAYNKLKTVHDAETLRKASKKYYFQVMNNLEVTGMDRCYFIAYYPGDIHIAEIKAESIDLMNKLQEAGEIRDYLINKFK